MSEAVNIVRCAKHGQQLAECFVCGAAVEQVSMVPEAERDALAARVEALQREVERAVETRENANTVSVRVEQENRALAARVEELEARIARADKALPEYQPYCTCEFCEQTVEVRRILRGEDER